MSVKALQITTNITPTGASSGDVGLNFHMNPSIAGTFVNKSYGIGDFWRTGNIVYDAQHKEPSYEGVYGSNSYSIEDVYSAVKDAFVKTFAWDFTSNASGYAGMYLGAANDSSSGSQFLKWKSSAESMAGGGALYVTAKDNVGSSFTVLVTIDSLHDYAIAWQPTSGGVTPPPALGCFVGSGQTFKHPMAQVTIEPYFAKGMVAMDTCRYDDVIAADTLPVTAIDGVQLALTTVNSGDPDYSFYIGKIKLNQIVIDGPVSDPKRYKGIPRWTYKWVGNLDALGYGAWRGPMGVGYSWLSGWYESKICANGMAMSSTMMQMMRDSQDEWKVQFPAKLIGPFMPRYGRASWEALNTGGYVAGAYTSNTYNKWYYPDTDDWYGYMMRALLSVARYYYLYPADPNAKTVLDRWMTWLDTFIIADGAYWWPPSDFYNDGTVGYTYHPVYAYACIAQACIYKYWVDGDALAAKWFRRLLDDIYARKRLTATGNLGGVSRLAEGQHYTNATCTIVGSGGAGAQVTPRIFGGKITRYDVTSIGAGYTSVTAVVSGDGTGASATAFLSDRLVGAFDAQHTGWELSELFNTYALLVNSPPPGGTVNFTSSCSVTSNDQVAFTGLIDLYARNTTDVRPSLLNSDLLPLHEWDIDPYHNDSSIEGPMTRDTHVRGALWTETLAPTLYAAVEYGRYTNSWAWLGALYNFVLELNGELGGSTFLTPTPRVSLGLTDGYTDIIGGECLQSGKRGNYDGLTLTANSSNQLIIPASAGGGDVTYVRGAWLSTVPFKYSGFAAEVDSAAYSGDRRNYCDVLSGGTAVNTYTGSLSTVLGLSSIAAGAVLQPYYAYRDGSLSVKGQAMSGWPYLHVDPYQGTANDGDNYLMMALYHAYRVTRETKYADTADRIGAALLRAGCWTGNEVNFNIGLDEEGGQVGLYSYVSSTATSAYSMAVGYKSGNGGLNSLHVTARVWKGQTPAHYAGLGLWPTWDVSTVNPFQGFEFSFCWD